MIKLRPIKTQEELDKIVCQEGVRDPLYSATFLPHDLVINNKPYQAINVPNFPHTKTFDRLDTLYAYPIDDKTAHIEDLIALPNNIDLVRYDFSIDHVYDVSDKHEAGLNSIVKIFRNDLRIYEETLYTGDRLKAAAYASFVIDKIQDCPIQFYMREYWKGVSGHHVFYRGNEYFVECMIRETSELKLVSVGDPTKTVYVLVTNPHLSYDNWFETKLEYRQCFSTVK